MLSVYAYSQEYINECRLKVDIQLKTYENLITTAKKQAGNSNVELKSAIESFEPNFFNNMVLVLDNYFNNRSRNLEKKDGNPLNEIRMLCDSIKENNCILIQNKTIKYDHAKSVLKYQIGDEIKLRKEDFVLLSKEFFAEIESKFMSK
ncbi:hypothetical protein [Bacillus sp. FJAT-22090]|uniref:hypothetical protein n=1 Tax=Bacillus sp. FJAT-22090 TaxID=1581038 RepID=UPI0006B03D97|nr:hypothetical protein [Bacillus sp. FJAT-22090]